MGSAQIEESKNLNKHIGRGNHVEGTIRSYSVVDLRMGVDPMFSSFKCYKHTAILDLPAVYCKTSLQTLQSCTRRKYLRPQDCDSDLRYKGIGTSRYHDMTGELEGQRQSIMSPLYW